MGMSGGADSSYMLHLVVKEFGLRPLVFHVDAGWNSDLAVRNIQVMIDKLELDLYTEVVNWEEVKEFQLALFRSGTSSLDLAQDHCFVAVLYQFASKHNIKYILNGGNFATEVVRNPKEYFYYGTDMAMLKDIIKKHATKPLPTYPFSNILWHKVYLPYIRGIKVVKPLNYQPYIKSEAMEFLRQEYDWTPYPRKHDESRFTRFFESYWLPTRFGFDTRRVQYSSLILSGQMTRGEALEELKSPPMGKEEIKSSREYIASKLEISLDQLDEFLNMPIKTFRDYKNTEWMFEFGARVFRLLNLEKSIKR
jgi:N-acetyl sugar amidotransferase